MNKKHRIFIAINLPNDIKKYLANFQKKWPELEATWVQENNLHITLVFLGYLTAEALGEVCMAAKEVAKSSHMFDITLKKITYGPIGKMPPRMVWAAGEKSKEMSLLKRALEDRLQENINFRPEERAYSPHITLAKFSAFAWRQINEEERPEVDEAIDLAFTVESIEVMESKLKRTGPEYSVVESFSLGENI